MLLIELFDKDNILCPEWLSDKFLEDDWEDSTYSFKDNFHTWSLENPFGKSRICFNGDEYHFQACDDNGVWVPVETITKDYVTKY